MRRILLVGVALLAATPVFAAVAADPRYAPEQSADPDDRMICKQFPQTGSLVNVRRICATKKRWSISRADLRQTTNLNSCALQAEAGHC